MQQLKGWGGLYGGSAYVGDKGFGVEFNFPTKFFTDPFPAENSGELLREMGISIAPPKYNRGRHFGIYAEGSYTWLYEKEDWDNVVLSLTSNFGLTKSQANRLIKTAKKFYEELQRKGDLFEEQFSSENIQNLEEGTYIWNGKEWVKDDTD
ncbi:MAG: hypothetical protein ED557_12030 [Balneola sp.]|nr:MAG: hypothetical protein ED557_12030 [Balneola sp.]